MTKINRKDRHPTSYPEPEKPGSERERDRKFHPPKRNPIHTYRVKSQYRPGDGHQPAYDRTIPPPVEVSFSPTLTVRANQSSYGILLGSQVFQVLTLL